MPIYEWYCDDCLVKWERILRMSDHLPRKTKCPSCSKLSERLFDQATPVIFKGGGWSDPVKNMTHYKKGAADEINKELQASTKRRMESGNQHYSKMEFNPDGWNKSVKESSLEKDKGYFKPLSEKGKRNKRESARNLTTQTYDKHGNGQKPHNPKVKNQ